MKRSEREQLEAFVRARTAELTDESLRSAHGELIALTDRIRTAATRDADWDFLAGVLGEVWFDDGGGWSDEVTEDAIFGDDPKVEAEAITIAILAAMALAHADHPDYAPSWRPTRRS
jgi:hypothetical protein